MIKHYYYFEQAEKLAGDSMSRGNWDTLREGDNGSFAIEKSKENWERNCRESDSYRRVASSIIEGVSKEYKRWISFGMGKGILEWNIMDLDPSITVSGTDYAKQSVEKLKNYFDGKSEVFCFDMLAFESYKSLQDYDVAVMCRISTEFDKNQWRMIFDAMYETSVKQIAFIPDVVVTPKVLWEELFSHWCHIITGKKDVFCGYRYSKKELEAMFGKWNISDFRNGEDIMWILSKS